LRQLVGFRVDELDVGVLQPVLLQCRLEQQVVDEAEFDTDLLSLQAFDGAQRRFRDDHVVARGIVGQQDHHVPGTRRARHERVTIRDRDRIEFARGERIDRRRIIEPLEVDVDAGLLEPAFVERDLERDPAGPVAVADFQRRGRVCGGRGEQGAGERDGAACAADGTGGQQAVERGGEARHRFLQETGNARVREGPRACAIPRHDRFLRMRDETPATERHDGRRHRRSPGLLSRRVARIHPA